MALCGFSTSVGNVVSSHVSDCKQLSCQPIKDIAVNLTDAIKIACDVHRYQIDKGGEAYILHSLRVMLSMKTEDERVVAVLHDVFEDGDSIEHIRKSLTEKQEQALYLLTRDKSETYEEYIAAICSSGNDIAVAVKIADIRDNLRDDRSKNISASLRGRYEKALDHLICAN